MTDKIKEVMGLVDEYLDSKIKNGSYTYNEKTYCARLAIETKLRELVPVWLPIETAPKNVDVLVLAHGRQYVALFVDDATDPYFEAGSAESDFNGLWTIDDNKHGPYALRGGNPSHWMPLPKEPV